MGENKLSILVVDDEEAVRKALGRCLRQDPYEVHFASNGFEALDKLTAHPVDIVISDHLMPGMTGMELLKVIKNRWPDAMRIILTGHADLEIAIAAINLGEVYRFITKPWENTDLRVALYLARNHRELERQHESALALVQRQREIIEELEKSLLGTKASHTRYDANGRKNPISRP